MDWDKTDKTLESIRELLGEKGVQEHLELLKKVKSEWDAEFGPSPAS